MWWLYIIECADSTLYTGITTDVERRFAKHQAGTGAKYCRGRAPLKLLFSYSVENRSVASKLELKVKALTKADKLKLITASSAVEIETFLGLVP